MSALVSGGDALRPGSAERRRFTRYSITSSARPKIESAQNLAAGCKSDFAAGSLHPRLVCNSRDAPGSDDRGPGNTEPDEDVDEIVPAIDGDRNHHQSIDGQPDPAQHRDRPRSEERRVG